MQKILEENFIEVYLTPKALAHRWSLTLHTLEQWRWKGRGPRFFKAGNRIRYPQKEVERFEADLIQSPTVDPNDKRFLCIDLESLILKKKSKDKERK